MHENVVPKFRSLTFFSMFRHQSFTLPITLNKNIYYGRITESIKLYISYSMLYTLKYRLMLSNRLERSLSYE